MNEDFVSFDLAKKLKEKGFKEKCIATYDIEDGEFDFNNYVLRVAYQMNVTAKDCLRLFNNTNTGLIDAPTISQVLKWLRERDIQVAPWYHRIKKQWSCAVSYNNGEYNTILYNDYTDAAMSGIEYVIDNLM